MAVVGGTSLLASSLFSHLREQIVETPYGKVVVHTDGEVNKICFLQRHQSNGDVGSDVYHPPHLINHRANFHALSLLKVDAILAICSVGSLQRSIEPGTIVIPDDYFYLFGPAFSCFDDSGGHIVPSLDQTVRQIIIDSVIDQGFQQLRSNDATYVQTMGPRFETPAETRFLSGIGHVVGMTGAHEATAARELKIPYAILAMVDNYANGLAEADLTYTNFKESVAKNRSKVEKAVESIVERLSKHRF